MEINESGEGKENKKIEKVFIQVQAHSISLSIQLAIHTCHYIQPYI